MPRLFVPLNLEAGATLRLPPDAAHRLREVLRLRPGDTLTLVGDDLERDAEVVNCTRDGVEVRIGEARSITRESPLSITLAQGLARGERMDYTLQKAVELGVTAIVPLATERSQVKLDENREARRLEHWRGIIQHACEQSGRNRLPTLGKVVRVADFIGQDHAEVRLTLAPGAPHNLQQIGENTRSFSLVIGPEGGLSPGEIALLVAYGYRAVRLGPRILRTETAALVALTAIQTLYGDLGH